MRKQIFVFILYLSLYVLNTNTLLINIQPLHLTICYLTEFGEFVVPLRQEGLIYFWHLGEDSIFPQCGDCSRLLRAI